MADRNPAMRADTRERTEAITAFLAEKKGHMRVGSIAALPGCPIRPPKEAEYLGQSYKPSTATVGQEPHCQKVTAALEAAVKLGIVTKTRAGGGPWRYAAIETVSA